MNYKNLILILLVIFIVNMSGVYGQTAEEWIIKGKELEKNKKFDEAVECYNKAIAADLLNIAAWTNKGRIFEKQKKYQEAINCYDKVLSVEKENFEILQLKGIALFNLEKYEEAVACYDKALKINPKDKQLKKKKKFALSLIEENSSSFKIKSLFSAFNIMIMIFGILFISVGTIIIIKVGQSVQNMMLRLKVSLDPPYPVIGRMVDVLIHVNPVKEVDVTGYWAEIKCVRHFRVRRYNSNTKRHEMVDTAETLASDKRHVQEEVKLAPQVPTGLKVNMMVPIGGVGSRSSFMSSDKIKWHVTVGVEIPKAIDAQKTIEVQIGNN